VIQMKTSNMVKSHQDAPPAPLPYYYLTGVNDLTLQFESRFESGNLLAAIKISDNEYDMFL
jgi:hypothetical protein